MYGPDLTFLGVPPLRSVRCGLLRRAPTWSSSVRRSTAAPRTAPAPGSARRAIRQACYLPHDGSRPSLALRVDGLQRPAGARRRRRGDVSAATSIGLAGRARGGGVRGRGGRARSRSCSAATTRSRCPTRPGWPGELGYGRVSLVHFDAHADTGDIDVRLALRPRPADAPPHRVRRGARATGSCRSDCAATGPNRPHWTGWPSQRMRSYEMTEIVARGWTTCLTEAFAIATDDCDGVFLSVDVDVVDPGMAPGTGTPEPGGLTARAAARRGPPLLLRAADRRGRRGRGVAARTTTPRSPRTSATGSCSRPSRRIARRRRDDGRRHHLGPPPTAPRRPLAPPALSSPA